MTRRFLSVVLSVVFLYSSALGAQDALQVISFNAGLAKALGISLVPYVNQRLTQQITSLDAIVKPPFGLLLQEIWTKSAQKEYRKWAKSRGFHVASFDTNRNGLMIITSEPIESTKFRKFSQNTMGRRFGVLEAQIRFDGMSVRLLDAHTIFSSLTEVSKVHLSQLAEIAQITHETPHKPAIIGADLNVGPDLYFPNGTYDPAVEIWGKAFMTLLNPSWTWAGDRIEGVTWDQTGNPLVSKPLSVLKYLGVLDRDGSWGYSDSQLDHIFVSKQFIIEDVKIILNEPVDIKGSKARAVPVSSGKTFLSDHYACEALLTKRL